MSHFRMKCVVCKRVIKSRRSVSGWNPEEFLCDRCRLAAGRKKKSPSLAHADASATTVSLSSTLVVERKEVEVDADEEAEMKVESNRLLSLALPSAAAFFPPLQVSPLVASAAQSSAADTGSASASSHPKAEEDVVMKVSEGSPLLTLQAAAAASSSTRASPRIASIAQSSATAYGGPSAYSQPTTRRHAGAGEMLADICASLPPPPTRLHRSTYKHPPDAHLSVVGTRPSPPQGTLVSVVSYKHATPPVSGAKDPKAVASLRPAVEVAMPVALLSSSDIDTFRERGCVIWRGSQIGAVRLLAQELDKSFHECEVQGELISGGTQQYAAAGVTSAALLLPQWEAMFLRIVTELNAALHFCDLAYSVLGPKFLAAPFEAGMQEIHWDRMREAASKMRITCLFALSDHHHSTVLPTYKYDQLLASSHSPRIMRQKAALLDASNYHSSPVKAGDMILLHQGVPHGGSENHLPGTSRDMLFGIATPHPEEEDPSDNVFRWCYMRAAYGEESKQFAESLVNAQQYMDVLPSMHSDADRRAARAVLTRHGLKLGAPFSWLRRRSEGRRGGES